MATLYDVIQEGVELGWLGYLALPCPAGVKGPRFDKWNEIEIPSTPDEYERLMIDLCSRTSYMGRGCFNPAVFSWDLAVTCNTGVFLLDIDNKFPKENIDDLVPLMGDELLRYVESKIDVSDCPLSRTKSGGYHLYFSGEGVDWSKFNQGARLRGPEGTLLLDCRNPIKGCAMEFPTPGYEWIRPLQRLEELPIVPDALLDWIPKVEQEAVKTSCSASGGGYKTRALDYAEMERINSVGSGDGRALLAATLDYIQNDPACSMREGERNHNLLRVCNVAYSGAGLSEDLTRQIAYSWAEEAGFTDRGAIEVRIKAAVEWVAPSGFRGFIRRKLGLR